MSYIAKYAGVSVRAVQKFFELLRTSPKYNPNNYLTIEERANRLGGSSTNKYTLNKNFKMAMEWLKIRGFLNSPRSKINHIISSMQKEEKVHPPSPPKFTPFIKDSLNTDFQTFTDGVWINPMLKGLGIDPWAVTYASRYASEHVIVDTLEACKYQEKKKKIKNPSSYFMGVLKNKMFKGDKRC